MKQKETTKKAETAKLDGVEIDSGKKQEEPDFIGRLKAETEELTSRIGKLACFLDGPVYRKLSPTMAKLLFAQYHAMTAYRVILEMRLDLLREKG